MTQIRKLAQRFDELPYFHRWMHRADAKDVLFENGDFLLRKMKTDVSGDGLAVSVCWMREIRHFPVQKTSEGRYCFENRAFRLVKDLILWHLSTKIPLTEQSGVILKTPKTMADWELVSVQVQLEEEAIAWGRYGDVCEARLMLRNDGTDRAVAVKSVVCGEQSEEEVKEGRERLLHEARCLRELSHHAHILRIYGVTVDLMQPMMVMELMSGNLIDRLRDKPHLSKDSKRKLARMAIGAVVHMHCHGMIHRHICAKNCLVRTTAEGDTFSLKLTGFDLCEKLDGEEEFIDKEMPPLSLSVCPPEALNCKMWSKASDVWSFAVLEYELFNNGAVPYVAELPKTTKVTSQALLAFFHAGSRLPIPLHAPDSVKTHWRTCFEQDPKARPTAFQLMEGLSTSSNASPSDT